MKERIEAGKTYKVKDWGLMVAQYGVDGDDIILCGGTCFTKAMESAMPKNRAVTIINVDSNGTVLGSFGDGDVRCFTPEMLLGEYFTPGQRVLVLDNGLQEARERVFLGYSMNDSYPYVVQREDAPISDAIVGVVYRYCKATPEKQTINITVEINGKPVSPKTISAETWANLREESK